MKEDKRSLEELHWEYFRCSENILGAIVYRTSLSHEKILKAILSSSWDQLFNAYSRKHVGFLVQQTEQGCLPINNVQGVQVAQCTGNFSSVKSGSRLQEATLPLEMVEQLQETERTKLCKRRQSLLTMHLIRLNIYSEGEQ